MEQDGQHVGLVLSGGGAKGAYQAGVWKALSENGISHNIKVISGTSVGALNAYVFATIGNPDVVRSFWIDNIESIPSPNFRALSPKNIIGLSEALLSGKPFPYSGLLDHSELIEILYRLLPKHPVALRYKVYATALQCVGGALEVFSPEAYKIKRFSLDGNDEKSRNITKIMASCAMPWGFDPVEMDGMTFVDGGWNAMGGDNVPIAPILEKHREIRKIIVVMCNGPELDNAKLSVPSDIEVKVIRPAKQMSGAFDDVLRPIGFVSQLLGKPNPLVWSGSLSFARSYAELYFKAGYLDAKMVFPVRRRHLRLDL